MRLALARRDPALRLRALRLASQSVEFGNAPSVGGADQLMLAGRASGVKGDAVLASYKSFVDAERALPVTRSAQSMAPIATSSQPGSRTSQ